MDKMILLKTWMQCLNLYARWRKLVKENTDITQEMKELERKGYEQYKLLPEDLKNKFLYD